MMGRFRTFWILFHVVLFASSIWADDMTEKQRFLNRLGASSIEIYGTLEDSTTESIVFGTCRSILDLVLAYEYSFPFNRTEAWILPSEKDVYHACYREAEVIYLLLPFGNIYQKVCWDKDNVEGLYYLEETYQSVRYHRIPLNKPGCKYEAYVPKEQEQRIKENGIHVVLYVRQDEKEEAITREKQRHEEMYKNVPGWKEDTDEVICRIRKMKEYIEELFY